MEAMTVKVAGREFAVTTRTGIKGELVYELHGKRGAHYFTMRNVHRPHMMFLCNARGFGPATIGDVWLTDADGTLKEVR